MEGAVRTGAERGTSGEVGPVAMYQVVQVYFNILIAGIALLVPMRRLSVLLSPKKKVE